MTILTTTSDFDTNSVFDWQNYRQKYFPIANKWRYFDHAAVSPLSAPARNAISSWLGEATEDGDTAWPQWSSRLEQIRKTAAELVRADKNEIAFVPSTSFGISLVAEGLDWQPGDNIVLPAGEFPSNLYPWMNLESQGVELRVVKTGPHGEVAVDQIDQACDSKTRLVTCSWVGYASGYRVDPSKIAEVAHRHGAFFFLDAIQGLGVFPLDVEKCGVDFFAADGHKWLMGPEGAGIFYCRHELLDAIRPRVIGWNSVKTSHDFSKIDLTLKDSASRFEAGTQNVAGILGLGGSLDLITAVGVNPESSPIGARVLEITRYLITSLQKSGWTCQSSIDDQVRSGIVSFSKTGIEPAEARQRLLDCGIVTSVRKNWLRFSPHAYVNENDVDLVVEVLSR